MPKHRIAPRVAGDSKKATNDIFAITCKGVKASEFITREKYKWVNEVITDKRFPIERHSPQRRLVELVKFNRDMTSEEILAEFKHRGLERPTYEDVFVFGDTYPRRGRRRPVVFLHKPVTINGLSFVLALDKYGYGRGLDIGWFDSTWSQRCVFAAVRK